MRVNVTKDLDEATRYLFRAAVKRTIRDGAVDNLIPRPKGGDTMVGKGFGFGPSPDNEIPVPDPRRPVPKAGETWYVMPNLDSKTVMKVRVIDVTPRTVYLQRLYEDGGRVHSDKKRWLRSVITFVERVDPPESDPGTATATTAPGTVTPGRGFVPGGVKRNPWYDCPVFNGCPVAGEDLRVGDALVYGDDGRLYDVGSTRIGNDPLFPVTHADRVTYYDKNGNPRKEEPL